MLLLICCIHFFLFLLCSDRLERSVGLFRQNSSLMSFYRRGNNLKLVIKGKNPLMFLYLCDEMNNKTSSTLLTHGTGAGFQ